MTAEGPNDRAAVRDALEQFPVWVSEVDFALPVMPQLVLVGNVRDVHYVPSGSKHYLSTVQAVDRMLRLNGFEVIFAFDLVDDITVLHESRPGQGAELLARCGPEDQPPLERIAAILDLLGPKTPRTAERGATVPGAVILDYASRFRVGGESSDAVHRLFMHVEKHADTTLPVIRDSASTLRLFNPVIWIADRAADLPEWLTESARSRTIVIPRPSLVTRTDIARSLIRSVVGYGDLDEQLRARTSKRFAELTDGMTVQEMRDVTTLAVDRDIPLPELETAVRALRAGVGADPWRVEGMRETLERGYEQLSTRIFGQPSAVDKALDVLYRAHLGLNGAQGGDSHPNRPKGVLFFAGPTGVGKTELAKQLAELVFGTEESLLRFDMSEYTSEASEARLIGAPPSYVGHEAGGQLTNAVRSTPFAILLFDEIEKAHPSILRKFLQVLEDGRLTDGHGKTVSFADTLIIFTSNRGVKELSPAQHAPVDVRDRIFASVVTWFERDLDMPELLNRIGKENIAVFDFIRTPDDERILDRDIDNVVSTIQKLHGVALGISDEARAALRAGLADYTSYGGRGIANLVQDRLVNPLGRALFAADSFDGARLCTVDSLRSVEGAWRAEVTVR